MGEIRAVTEVNFHQISLKIQLNHMLKSLRILKRNGQISKLEVDRLNLLLLVIMQGEVGLALMIAAHGNSQIGKTFAGTTRYLG